MLYWNTVNPLLKESLLKLMQAEELKKFRLVGGTALSLYLGHRMSVDIDMFTDAAYGSVNFNKIEKFLQRCFDYVSGDFGSNPGLGKSYTIGTHPDNSIKLDIYYSMDPFFQNYQLKDSVRLATIDEIVAMKVDIIQRGGRKKDFWDLHELLSQYSIRDMIALHRQRFEWTHDSDMLIKKFNDFSIADEDLDPQCLKGKYWEFIKEDLEAAFKL